MKSEELFEAIGNVESSRLLRTESETTAPSNDSNKEGKTMKKDSAKRMIRNLLITFLFNRMIDVKEISSVILDGGLEYSVG